MKNVTAIIILLSLIVFLSVLAFILWYWVSPELFYLMREYSEIRRVTTIAI